MINKNIRNLAAMLIIVTSGLCYAQDNLATAITHRLDNEGNLHISVTNRMANTIHFLCSIEREINGEWREIVLDVSNVKPSKSAKVQRLDPHKTVDFVWPRKTYVSFLPSSEGIVRVKVVPTDRDGAPAKQAIYSDSIALKK